MSASLPNDQVVTSRKQKFIKIAIILLLVSSAGLVVYVMTHNSPAATPYEFSDTAVALPHRLRNSAEHDETRRNNGGNPYILELSGKSGSLVYYGASHSRDPKHPQVADITRRWTDFKPTAALYEGRQSRFVWGALIEPFAGLPESALVHKLAARDNVRVYSLEPSYEAEVAHLTQRFDANIVALYFFLRVYAAEAGGAANDSLASHLLAKRTDVRGLQGTLPSLDDVDQLWETIDSRTDWRVQKTEPVHGVFGEISTASRHYRGQHMIRVIDELVQQGERVFAVVGSGHVIRQEWNLRELFGAPPASDQPQTLERI